MALKKHSVLIAGHRTSITLEDEFWQILKSVATQEKVSLAQLVTRIDHAREPATNLSSALRLYVLKSLQDKK